MSKGLILAASVAVVFSTLPALAATDASLQSLRAEIQAMKQVYERKIDRLEKKVANLEAIQSQTAGKATAIEPTSNNLITSPATSKRRVNDNIFNPEIGIILQGQYQSFSERTGEFSGFAVGEEAERGNEGFAIDETELNFSANIDDKFRGNATIALHEHGDEIEVEIEEVYIEATSLPYGLHAKAGRFFSELGYLNSHHAHADDFADRSLPNRAFLDSNYGDDGLQVSVVLPTDLYAEIGGGVYRGDDFPGGGAAGNDIGSWTAYGRLGGDIGDKTSWRLGLSTLQSDNATRSANEGEVSFAGDSSLYIVDTRVVHSPTGNNAEREILFQAEYFHRDEEGVYDVGNGAINYDDGQNGWYAQGVYKFLSQWRAGTRVSQLYAGDVPVGLIGTALDDQGHDAWAVSAMVDWTHSEFSRLRFQFSHEELRDGQRDNQLILQYVVSLGAHGAHPF